MIDDKIVQRIKNEYIAGRGSQKALAEKYGVSVKQIQKIAGRERWTELRGSAAEKAEKNMVEVVAAHNARTDDDFFALVDQLIELTGMSMRAASAQGVPSAAALDHYANAIGTIQKIRGIKSSLDTEEQKARIEKLRKEIESGKDNEGIIIDLGGAAAWAK